MGSIQFTEIGKGVNQVFGGDRGSQARAIRFAGIRGEAFDRHSDLRRV
jgi:hypothetical protein